MSTEIARRGALPRALLAAPLALALVLAGCSDDDTPGGGGDSAALVDGSGGGTDAGGSADSAGGGDGGASIDTGGASIDTGGATGDGGGATGDGGSTADAADPYNDKPGNLKLASTQLAKGWYQYYQGSVQYRPAGEFFAIDLDSTGVPHVVHEAQSGGVTYRVASGSGWKSENRFTDSRYGYIPNRLVLRADPKRLPVVLVTGRHYVKYPTLISSVHSYRFDGYKWLDDHPVSGIGTYLQPIGGAMRVDAKGHVHLAFYGRKPPGTSGTKALIYTYHDGTAWKSEVVDNAEVAGDHQAVQLALDGKGSPVIAYVVKVTPGAASQPPLEIKVAWRSAAGTWKAVTAEDYIFIRTRIGFGVAADGTAHVAFADDKYSHVYHTTGGAQGAFTRSRVDDQGNVGWGVSLAVDNLGRPHLAYIEKDKRQLRYARRLAGAWDVYRPTATYANRAGTSGGPTALTTDIGVDAKHLAHVLVGGFHLDYVVCSR